jgi:hypothetical protein
MVEEIAGRADTREFERKSVINNIRYFRVIKSPAPMLGMHTELFDIIGTGCPRGETA